MYAEMVKKMQAFQTLKGTKTESYNPKLTAARAKTETKIEKLLDTLSGATPTLLQYANSRIDKLDAKRQTEAKLVADLTAISVSSSQVDSITAIFKIGSPLTLTTSAVCLTPLFHKCGPQVSKS